MDMMMNNKSESNALEKIERAYNTGKQISLTEEEASIIAFEENAITEEEAEDSIYDIR